MVGYPEELDTLIKGSGITPLWIGTQSNNNVKHEGRAGWKITDFAGFNPLVVSPFWDGTQLNFKKLYV